MGNRALDAADFKGRSKTNAQEEKGGQPGNQNAVKHGRFSAPVRTARRAAWEDRERRSAEWMKTMPKTDYGAICDGIRQSALLKNRSKQDE
jgi:uncharacterized protein YjcR